jgi:hypothetical protein
VVKLRHHRGKREIERPQSEDREDVRREDDERVRRDGKDGWNGVDGEDDVGSLDGRQHQEKRGRVSLAGLDDGEMPTAIVVHRRNESPEQPEEWVSFGMDLVGPLHEAATPV